jgi:hypothetical protein
MTHHVYILTNIATFAPSLLHIRAMALPIPRPPPVTRTRWPAKRSADDVIMAEEEVMDSSDVMKSSEDRRNDAIINLDIVL